MYHIKKALGLSKYTQGTSPGFYRQSSSISVFVFSWDTYGHFSALASTSFVSPASIYRFCITWDPIVSALRSLFA